MKDLQMIKYKKNIFKNFFDKIINKIFRKRQEEKSFSTTEEHNLAKNITIKEELKIDENSLVQNNVIINSKSSHSDLRKALTEVKILLTGFDESIVQKIPEKFMNYINQNCDKQYVPNINPNININDQELLRKTRVILAIIYKKYIANI